MEIVKSKKVLILCTGNSCRSIIAEALINARCENIQALSSGVKASGNVNKNAKLVLQKHNIWKDSYRSKTIEAVMNTEFDLVITVCDNAKENCPIFPKKVNTIHIPFDDPDGKSIEEFEKTYQEIEEILLPKVKEILS